MTQLKTNLFTQVKRYFISNYYVFENITNIFAPTKPNLSVHQFDVQRYQSDLKSKMECFIITIYLPIYIPLIGRLVYITTLKKETKISKHV